MLPMTIPITPKSINAKTITTPNKNNGNNEANLSSGLEKKGLSGNINEAIPPLYVEVPVLLSMKLFAI